MLRLGKRAAIHAIDLSTPIQRSISQCPKMTRDAVHSSDEQFGTKTALRKQMQYALSTLSNEEVEKQCSCRTLPHEADSANPAQQSLPKRHL